MLLLVLYSLSSLQASTHSSPQKDVWADHSYLKTTDLPHPFCESGVELNIDRETFIPLTEREKKNKGYELYNSMVENYRWGQWSVLDTYWEELEELLEGGESSLFESADFLYTISLFERSSIEDESSWLEAEKRWRDLEIKYPKSTWFQSGRLIVGNFFLRAGKFERALAQYQLGISSQPIEEYQCLYQLGLAESSFRLRDFTVAEKTLNGIQKNCQNPRVTTLASVRQADMGWLKGDNTVEKRYEKLIENGLGYVERFSPAVYQNLAEIKYRKKEYGSAKHYFSEYLKFRKRDENCLPYTYKRLADIDLRTGVSWDRVAGSYLEVSERYPNHDIGRYSYIVGLLLGLPTYPKEEHERRFKIVDGVLEQIKEYRFRSIGFLYKGLVMLHTGNPNAVAYLERLDSKVDFKIREGVIARFIRDRMLNILFGELEEKIRNDKEGEKLADNSIYSDVEHAYNSWLKESEVAQQAQIRYKKALLHQFQQYIADDELDSAIKKLNYWQKSALFPKEGIDFSTQKLVSEDIAELLVDFDGEAEEHPSILLLKHEEILRPFFHPTYDLIWAEVAIATGDHNHLKKMLTKRKYDRMLASVDNRISPEISERFLVTVADAWRVLGQYSKAESFYSKVTESGLKSKVEHGLFQIAIQQKNLKRAIDILKEASKNWGREQGYSYLGMTRDLAISKDAWGDLINLRKVADKYRLSAKELAPYAYAAGKAYYKQNNFKSSIQELTQSLEHEGQFLEAIEARFLLGKSYLKQGKRDRAKELFNQVATSKDLIWSKLAQSELSSLQ